MFTIDSTHSTFRAALESGLRLIVVIAPTEEHRKLAAAGDTFRIAPECDGTVLVSGFTWAFTLYRAEYGWGHSNFTYDKGEQR